MTDDKFIEIVKEKLKNAGDNIDDILKNIPDGETVTNTVKYENESLTYSYNQKAKATLAILHGIDIEEELKEIAIRELQLKN